MVVKKISELTEDEIKKELTKRGIETSGDKAELFVRLRKILVEEAMRKKAQMAQSAMANGTPQATIAEAKPVEAAPPTPSHSRETEINQISSPSIEPIKSNDIIAKISASMNSGQEEKLNDTAEMSKTESSTLKQYKVEEIATHVSMVTESPSKMIEDAKVVEEPMKVDDIKKNESSTDQTIKNPITTEILEKPNVTISESPVIRAISSFPVVRPNADKINSPSTKPIKLISVMPINKGNMSKPQSESENVSADVKGIKSTTTVVATPITKSKAVKSIPADQSISDSLLTASMPVVQVTPIVVVNKSPVFCNEGSGDALNDDKKDVILEVTPAPQIEITPKNLPKKPISKPGTAKVIKPASPVKSIICEDKNLTETIDAAPIISITEDSISQLQVVEDKVENVLITETLEQKDQVQLTVPPAIVENKKPITPNVSAVPQTRETRAMKAGSNLPIKNASPTPQTKIGSTPVTKTPVIKTPVTKTPVTKTPVTITPVTKTPVTKTPVIKSPVTKTPVTKTPITKTNEIINVDETVVTSAVVDSKINIVTNADDVIAKASVSSDIKASSVVNSKSEDKNIGATVIAKPVPAPINTIKTCSTIIAKASPVITAVAKAAIKDANIIASAKAATEKVQPDAKEVDVVIKATKATQKVTVDPIKAPVPIPKIEEVHLEDPVEAGIVEFDATVADESQMGDHLVASNLDPVDIKSTDETLDIEKQDLIEDQNTVKEEKKSLWITGLPKAIKANDLRMKLNEYGKIVSTKIVTSAKDPGCKCFGFVLCEDEKNAQSIIDALNNTQLFGSLISVNFDTRKKLTITTPVASPKMSATPVVAQAPIKSDTTVLTEDTGIAQTATKSIPSPEDAPKVNGGEQKKVVVKNIIPPPHSFWILGFATTMKAADLKQLCLKFGKVLSSKVILTAANKANTKYYGLLTMSTEEEVNKCIKEINGIVNKGCRLCVKKHTVGMSVIDFLATLASSKEGEVKKPITKLSSLSVVTKGEVGKRGGFRGTSHNFGSTRGRGQFGSSSRGFRTVANMRGNISSLMRGAPFGQRMGNSRMASIMDSIGPHFGQMNQSGVLGGGVGFLQVAHDNLLEERRRQEQSVLNYQREQLELEKLKLERERVESERVRVQMMREREEWRRQESAGFKRPNTEAPFYEHPTKRRASFTDQTFYPSNSSGRYSSMGSFERSVPSSVDSSDGRNESARWPYNRNNTGSAARGRFSNRW